MADQTVSFIACLGADGDHEAIHPHVISWKGEVPYNAPNPDGTPNPAIPNALAVYSTFEAAMNRALNEFETQYRAELRAQFADWSADGQYSGSYFVLLAK